MSQVKQYDVRAGVIVHIDGFPVKLLHDTKVETAYLVPRSALVGFVPPPGPPAVPDTRHIHNPVA